jgi:hypothetical protein
MKIAVTPNFGLTAEIAPVHHRSDDRLEDSP